MKKLVLHTGFFCIFKGFAFFRGRFTKVFETMQALPWKVDISPTKGVSWMKNKYAAFFLALSLTSLTACGSFSETEPESTSSAETVYVMDSGYKKSGRRINLRPLSYTHGDGLVYSATKSMSLMKSTIILTSSSVRSLPSILAITNSISYPL